MFFLARLIRLAMVRFGHQEAHGDLGGGRPPTARKSAGSPHRGEDRVAAQEQQRRESSWRTAGRGGRFAARGQVFAVSAGVIGAPQVGQPAGGDGDQPAARVGGQALGGQ